MSLQQREDVDKSAPNTNSSPNWTVLVRVGKESWHIGDSEDAVDGKSDDESSVDWERAARQFRRKSKYSVQIRYLVETWLRQLWRSGETFLAQYFFGKNTAAAGSRAHSRRFRDSLQFGLIAGLLLGCMSLVLFHQMVPATGAGSASRKVSFPPQSNGSVGTTVPVGSAALTLPAFHLYSLNAGSYSTEKAAISLKNKLHKQGIWSAVVPVNHKFDVLTGDSMYNGSLKQAQADLKQKTGTPGSVITLNYGVTKVPLQSGLSGGQARTITTWLTSTVGSLNTITAAAANGEPQRDAKATYDAALKLAPSTSILKKAVNGTQLVLFKQHWQAAYSALAKKHASVAEQESLLAYAALLGLQNHN
ncbi:SPOR domain-containing protein [Alicyclobacillus sp. SO9]|uniref:SPOR domain-containing protein n=1 Tax=Alicyclobacillus sp. SO9 TaxID=2665646 RepID=UPI0018E7E78B|nr:SPOR domain-containing protein [Alicyclobacillus sp. SO9]QQE77009.1 SPOR domain-containing protein [Alicyclobacillus sp. SO9]